jgi:hypothetical protein
LLLQLVPWQQLAWLQAADDAAPHGLLVLVLVLMGLPLLKLAARSLKVLALSRHSARRAMPATISGASGATCGDTEKAGRQRQTMRGSKQDSSSGSDTAVRPGFIA